MENEKIENTEKTVETVADTPVENEPVKNESVENEPVKIEPTQNNTTAENSVSPESSDKPKKSHKGLVIGCVIGLAAVAAAVGGYLYKAQDYITRFAPGTTINGIDAAGCTVEEIEAQLKTKVENYSLQVAFPGGKSENLDSAAMGLSYESDGSVAALLEGQNPYYWGKSYLGMTDELTASENYTQDSAKLAASIKALPEFQEGNYQPSTNAYMQLGEDNQFTIVKETYGTQLNEDSVIDAIADVIDQKGTDAVIDESYYLAPEILSDNADLVADLEKNNAILKSTITYTLHDKKTYEIGGEQLRDWFREKEGSSGYFVIDEELVKEKAAEAAAALAEVEDCSYNTFSFKSTTRGTQTIRSGKYGCTVDQEAEAEQIVKDILSGEAVNRKPIYSKEYQSPLGSTYVEVDLTNQKVYMYKNGSLVVSGSCVSGKDSDPDRRSDKGFFHVTRRHTNYTMHGAIDPATGRPEYESFCNFAVFYNGGEALHDASWRSTFGGSIYKTNGSHGCINLPYGVAQKIYQNSYVGMPVIVF